MAKVWLFCALLFTIDFSVSAESTFAGSSVTSDSGGTRSVLVSGRNGVVQTRLGNGGSGISVGSRSGDGGAYAAAGAGPAGAYAGPAGAYAGPAGAYAGPGGAYAGAAPFGFPYWNGGGAYASTGGGYYPPPYQYDSYPYQGSYGNGGGVGVYSSSDSNGVQTRFGSVGPGGRATVVEQNGDEPPRVYTYRGSVHSSAENKDADN